MEKKNICLDFNNTVWEKESALGARYCKAEGVLYCHSPTAPDKQRLNIYVPVEYLNCDGTVNRSGRCGGYTAETAPILYINSIGLYLGKVPYKITEKDDTLAGKNGWYYDYVKQGYVIVFAGARGKDDLDENSLAVGKAPVGLSDLKAGVRFLRRNKDKIPGDTDKIISSGMSAGGAMSILLAASGNSDKFDYHLKAMGAVMDERDDVYASQAYCPITDLDRADTAYEFMYINDDNGIANGMGAFNKALSEKLFSEYISYLNGRNITVGGVSYTLGADGRSGSFYDYILGKFVSSYRAENDGPLPSFLSSLDTIVKNHNHRSKACPCFDSLFSGGEGASVECGVFGRMRSKPTDPDFKRHFSPSVAEQIAALKDRFQGEYDEYYKLYKAQSESEDVKEQVALYNPYTYLDEGKTRVASKIRICVGSMDSATSTAVSAQLALTLSSLGIDTEYEIMWGQGHTDADREGEFIAWVNRISK